MSYRTIVFLSGPRHYKKEKESKAVYSETHKMLVKTIVSWLIMRVLFISCILYQIAFWFAKLFSFFQAYVLDFGTEVYSWIGRNAQGAVRKNAAEVGLDHFHKGKVFSWVTFCQWSGIPNPCLNKPAAGRFGYVCVTFSWKPGIKGLIIVQRHWEKIELGKFKFWQCFSRWKKR